MVEFGKTRLGGTRERFPVRVRAARISEMGDMARGHPSEGWGTLEPLTSYLALQVYADYGVHVKGFSSLASADKGGLRAVDPLSFGVEHPIESAPQPSRHSAGGLGGIHPMRVGFHANTSIS